MLNEKFSRRFQELDEKFTSLPVEHDSYRGNYYPEGSWQQWATSCQSLTKAVYGTESPHYENLINAIAACNGTEDRVKAIRGIFLSAKEDFEGGYVFNIELMVSGEVFGDFVVLAKQALSEGHKDVAAVLASAALEDALKRYATGNGLNVQGKSMAEVINALKSRRLVSGARKSLLDTMPGVRNSAMHADWDSISEPEVNSVVGFVEQFLVSYFSS